MAGPTILGGMGIPATGLGFFGLGGPPPVQSFALPQMARISLSYIAHLYDHNLVFKSTLGGAKIASKPSLKQTQNGGFQPIVLRLAQPITGAVVGDVIRLTEQGDPGNAVLFSGNIETMPEEDGTAATIHTVEITPWIAELADAYFNKTYATPTDVAQFVRDAVAQTAHCSVTPASCGDSGVTAIYDFQNSNGLDAVHVAKQVAGASWWYGVDALGVVWFQPVYTDSNHPATITLRRGSDFNYKRSWKSAKGQKNLISIVGGSNLGDPGRIKSTYGVGDPLGHQALYGIRAFNPSLAYPSVTDQPTLDAIAASLGAQYDRVPISAEVRCPALGVRLSPFRPGGLTVRTFTPAVEALQEPGVENDGTYSPTLILQDVEAQGPKQILMLGDIPFTDLDPTYEVNRIAQRVSALAATAVATPALQPQLNPPTTVIYGRTNASAGIKPMGGGIVTIATATFTTPKTGTCQILAQVDARMEAWDNYIAAPRRALRATLSGGIFTGAWQELPFGLTRAVYDLSSASGIALTAGTYTVTIDIDTQEFNQMHIYSGWVQVAVIA